MMHVITGKTDVFQSNISLYELGQWVCLTDSLNCLHSVSHTPVRHWRTSTLSARITFYHDSWRLLWAQEIMMCEILINPDLLQAWSSGMGRWKYDQTLTTR